MTFGLQVNDAAGALMWESSTVAGGVFADVLTYAAAATDTRTYPAFAGRSAQIVNLLARVAAGAAGVSVDTALGYPRVTVAAGTTIRKFAVVVY